MKYAADLQAIREAHELIAPYVHRTDVLTCGMIDSLAGRDLFFKCENFQKVGAFKIRGASNAVWKLSDEAASRGVVTHSSGNHAQALAVAARSRGIEAHVVMPRNAKEVKRTAVAGYGGRIYLCEPTLAARESVAHEVIDSTGAVFIPSYDHPDIMAGQGTVALELLDQVSDLDAIVAPVGGGGLISGVSIAAKALSPGIRVFAAEPCGADDAARSRAAGRLIPQVNPQTIADGLLTSMGELTWPVIRDLVDDVITVADSEIIEAMRLLWERAKIVVEPSAATVLAAVLSNGFNAYNDVSRVGLVVSGGNVDLGDLPW